MAEAEGHFNKIIIVVTPLNTLGKQTEALLKSWKFEAIAVDGMNVGTPGLFKVRGSIFTSSQMESHIS
jgi:hypothetical protein